MQCNNTTSSKITQLNSTCTYYQSLHATRIVVSSIPRVDKHLCIPRMPKNRFRSLGVFVYVTQIFEMQCLEKYNLSNLTSIFAPIGNRTCLIRKLKSCTNLGSIYIYPKHSTRLFPSMSQRNIFYGTLKL